MKLLLKPIEQYESQIKAVDWYSHMADDHRSYKSGNAHKDTIRTIYTELNGGEKRKAWNQIERVKVLRKRGRGSN